MQDSALTSLILRGSSVYVVVGLQATGWNKNWSIFKLFSLSEYGENLW